VFLKGAYCIGVVTWAPDGQYVLYGCGFEYFRGCFPKYPAWSPDGSAIYFTANKYVDQHLTKILRLKSNLLFYEFE